jgi:hypothetical protein
MDIGYPKAHLGFLFITFFGELVFMLWLLIMGWRLKEPIEQTRAIATGSPATGSRVYLLTTHLVCRFHPKMPRN